MKRMADIYAPVSVELSGGIEEWPDNIQDHFYGALEMARHKTGVEWTIRQSECKWDYDRKQWTCHLIVVAALN